MAESEEIRADSNVSEESETSSSICQEDQSVVRKEGLKLLKMIEHYQEELGNIEYHGLLVYMNDVESWYSKVDSPQAATVDAKLVKIISEITKKQAEGVSANIIFFNATEYANRLVCKICGDDPMMESRVITRRRLVVFGRRVQCLFRKPPCLTSMLGALDVVPPDPKPAKPVKPKVAVARSAVALRETAEEVRKVGAAQRSGAENEVTERRVQSVLKCLVNLFKKNGSTPISFWGFAVDPQDFGATVENLFHISFLVNDSRVKVWVDESGLPVVQPISKGERKSMGGATKKQTVIAITMRDWNRMKESLQVREPMIPRREIIF